MRIILIVVGILAAIVAAVYAIGMTLPQNQTAARTTHLSAPPETVWSLISDYARYPEWRKDVTSNPVFRFVSKYVMGHTATIDKYLKSLSAKLGDAYEPGSA